MRIPFAYSDKRKKGLEDLTKAELISGVRKLAARVRRLERRLAELEGAEEKSVAAAKAAKEQAETDERRRRYAEREYPINPCFFGGTSR